MASGDEYLTRAKQSLLARGVPPLLREHPDRPAAYISDGRWVVDCPNFPCRNGPSASPEWGIAVCFECGAVITPVFPDDLAAAEDVLLARIDPLARHFFPDERIAHRKGLVRAETVKDLEKENRAAGLPVRRGRSER